MDDYQQFVLTVKRDINCLSDPGEKAVRRGAVVNLEKKLFTSGKANPEFVKRIFMEDLHKPLFRCFADQGEKCREMSIGMTQRFVDIISTEDLDNVLPLLLSALLGRLNRLPFPESSEELRLQALQLLRHLMNVRKEGIAPFASEVIDAMAKALTDTCPDAKKECCGIVELISVHFEPERVSRAAGPLIIAMTQNLRHQQWKVRKSTVESLGHLLSHEATLLDHMDDVLPYLNSLLGDRTQSVRQSLGDTLEKWLMKGLQFRPPLVSINDDDDVNGIAGFDKHEHRLLLLLLSIASDEDTDQVAKPALAGLERVAALKHEVMKAQAEKARVKARKAKEAYDNKGGYKDKEPEAAPTLVDVDTIKDPVVAPAFDYKSVHSLLPEPFKSMDAPAALTTSYLLHHLPTMLPQILGNLTQWTTEIRTAAARLLRVVLVELNRTVAPFLDQVLVFLYKAVSDDEPAVANASLQCAAMLGAFLDIDLVLSLVAKHLGLKSKGGGVGVEELWPEQRTGRSITRTVQDAVSVTAFTAATVENKRQVFAVLAYLMPPAAKSGEAILDAAPRLKLNEIQNVLHFLEEGTKSDELLPWIFGSTQAMLNSGVKACVDEWPRTFDLLLRMRSGDECDTGAVDLAMDQLALFCGKTRRQLYEEHLQTRLGELLMGADGELWEERSPKRHVLETLLRNAGAAVAPHVGSLIPALARQASPDDACMPARIDILGLLHFLILEEDVVLREALREHTPALLDVVLIPNCTWRVGQSNNKIRKGGMVCIHALLERHLISAQSLNQIFADLLPVLKSALDDSFSPDNRLIACLVLSATLSEMQAEVNGEQLREVYPEMLKRLDDSNDKVRVAICEALTVFFKCLPPKWSRSLYEYILRTLFVHLDDPSPDIQQGIYAALEEAVHQDYNAFIAEAKAAAGKSSHPRLCEELARLADSLRQASMDVDGEDAS